MVQGVTEVQPETLRCAEIWLQSQPFEAVHRKYITDLAKSFGETRQDKLTIGFLRAAIKAAAPSLGYVDKLCPSTNKRMLVKVSLAMAEVQAALQARREKSLDETKKKQEEGAKKRKELAEATAKNHRAAEEVEASASAVETALTEEEGEKNMAALWSLCAESDKTRDEDPEEYEYAVSAGMEPPASALGPLSQEVLAKHRPPPCGVAEDNKENGNAQ